MYTTTTELTPSIVFLIIIAIVAIISLYKGIQNVPEARARLVERFGRYHRVINPGLHFIVPFIDRIRKNVRIVTIQSKEGQIELVSLVDGGTDIHLSEQVMDPLKREMIAKDNAVIFPDVIAYFRIMEPNKAVYSVEDVGVSLDKLLETSLRQEVGKLDSDALVSSRDILGVKLQTALQEASISWGVRVTRVEIQAIEFDENIQKKLSTARAEELVRRAEVVKAQQARDTAILVAEGVKKSDILKAEGIKEAAILIAQGRFEAEKLQAEGNYLIVLREKEAVAKGFAAINAALSDRPEGLIALEALKAQALVAEALGKSNNMMIVPSEMAGLLGVIGALQTSLEKFAGKAITRSST